MPDDSQVVSAGTIRGGGDELGQRGQRTQPLAAPQRLHGGRRVVTQARGALVVAMLGERSDLIHRRAQCAVVQAVGQGHGAPHGRRVLRGRHIAGGRAGRHLQLGAGRPVQRRTRQPRRTRSDAGEARQQGRRRGGLGTGPERADGAVVSGRPHHRQPWKRLIGQHDPPPAPREPRPAVIRRGMCGQHPQLAYPGLQWMRAFHMVDRAGQRHHLGHPGAAIGAVEVLIHSAPQVDRRADVEHLAGRTAEQVDAGTARQAVGEHPLAALGRRHVGQVGAQVGISVYALVAHPLDQGVQHVDGGAGVVEGAVGGLGGDGEQPRQCGQPHAGRFLATQHPPGQPHRAQHLRPRPGNLAPFGSRP